MVKKKIFIFEFVSGGGFNKEEIPTSLLCEGFSMLRSVVGDFGNLDFTISTLLDHRISFLSPLLDADNIDSIGKNQDFIKQFKKKVKSNEYCFIIAPEFSNILKNLTQIVYKHDKQILSLGIDGIERCSSKFNTFQFFKSNNVSTPKTYLIPDTRAYPNKKKVQQLIKKVEFPVILKPDDGVGAESIYYFDTQGKLINFLDDVSRHLDPKRKYVLQNYISGRDLSILILNSRNLVDSGIQPLILSVNSQKIQIKGSEGNSEYFGGLVPVNNYQDVKKKVRSLLHNVNFRDFLGIFGIDFVYNNQAVNFIEINPRLTTSYIGLRYVLEENPIELLLQSTRGSLPLDKPKISHHSIFKRVELDYNGETNHEELCSKAIPRILEKFQIEFITPPFSLDKESRHYSCFIATKEDNKRNSLKKIEEIYNFLRDQEFTIC